MYMVWAGNWWAMALRAAAAIMLGVIAFTLTAPTLLALVIVFGIYALVDGLLALVAAIRGLRRKGRWGAMLLHGIVGTIAGVIALLNPSIGALALVYLVATWAFITGVLEITMAIRLRKLMTGEWLWILGGILSLALSILMVLFPAAGASSLVWVIGAYAIAYGVTGMVLAIRIRQWTALNLPPEPLATARGH